MKADGAPEEHIRQVTAAINAKSVPFTRAERSALRKADKLVDDACTAFGVANPNRNEASEKRLLIGGRLKDARDLDATRPHGDTHHFPVDKEHILKARDGDTGRWAYHGNVLVGLADGTRLCCTGWFIALILKFLG